jgi:hypothetical protein
LPGILTIDTEEGISVRLFGSFPDIPQFVQWNPEQTVLPQDALRAVDALVREFPVQGDPSA